MLVKLLFSILIFFASAVTITFGHFSARIVGGSYAFEGQFPYQVSVRRLDFHFCGGSIISKNFVLTAAHCVGYWSQAVFYRYPAKDYTIRAGSIDRLSGGVLISVDAIKTHEEYANYLYDVALLKLKNPLIYSKNIQPIPLASKATPVGIPVNVTGWGYTKDAGDISQKLKWNTLTTISRSECKEAINVDSEALICLSHEVGDGVCHYDSGGPAVWNNEIVGVANFIYFACGFTFPDAFANVFFHIDWIRSNSDLSKDFKYKKWKEFFDI